ncbi:hydroxymethylglutaryl-CoA reductase [Rubricoccus marinus]|uniref:hydroxymethylglutaryl-CoA reductase (NADPH) n=1 Tax=Rubricoccus marinus TaxID=716817 RepID=A0A259TZB2_9BACT|nr:hydroxymethylglutaryl-CoA reductase [Rubricoccus marinus]OZC02918.1 hydroxymethylglutaryl-CoA reductase [Rubricoccus marinus]
MKIPSLVLRQLYTNGSLTPTASGAQFSLKNRLTDAKLTGLKRVTIGGQEVSADRLTLSVEGGERFDASDISSTNPVQFPLRQVVHVMAPGVTVDEGVHEIKLEFEIEGMGPLKFKVKDSIQAERPALDEKKVPRIAEDDYGEEAIKTRQRFIEEHAGTTLEHIPSYSFDPQGLQGNIEAFTGVAQIPLGIAGPLRVNGEYAQGEFYIPMATTEGTLVASYNRGMKVLNLSGGVTCTVSDDSMQRAPVFIFENARGARDFRTWLDENFDEIAAQAESTTSVGKLQYIDTYLSNHFAFCRFNFHTGDAAGQNMVGRATFAACSWILENAPGIRRFYLESNFATDKKASMVNIMRTRGKRVTAECKISGDVLRQHMRVEPKGLAYHWGVAAGIGSVLSGANNNGLHSPNGITAMFIATGQDVANVSESSAAILYAEHTDDDDLFMSITIPSLIVATYGGGTGLATQRESLEMMGCYGKDKVRKLAEIIAGVVLAGEISLASAISSNDWVSSHEKYGRNR